MAEDFTGFLEFTKTGQHAAGKFLEAERWKLLDIEPGRLRVECHVPVTVLNLAGSVFGGFTPTYVDYIAIWTAITVLDGKPRWLSTMNMQIDYFEPLVPPGFIVVGRVRNRRKRDFLIETEFTDGEGRVAAFALVQLREMGSREAATGQAT